jgi:hypothetical protein
MTQYELVARTCFADVSYSQNLIYPMCVVLALFFLTVGVGVADQNYS